MANIEISILGQQYKIACPEGEEKALQKTVEQFNLKLNKIKSNTRTLRNEQLIVMVALNLCHELNTEKAKNQQQTQELNNRIQALHQSIENALLPIGR
ncbi:cell division protein ZapA [Psychromonas sp. CD1]|uniref:cell division protein ZapA n=1 Tax=Psychromonas sp. CD1 TaxID=1979839 RepID=UPI000B9B31C5|nr:cell division protein ZapA [Psychromonas sp. CD1]